MKKTLLTCLLLVGCGSSHSHVDIVGPYTGTTQRFVVDQLTLPQTRSEFDGDLDGNGKTDNQLGNITGTLAFSSDLTDAIGEMLASGVLQSVVEITSDDPQLRDDAEVGVRFLGQDGEAGDVMGARLVGGALSSNRTQYTTHPAHAALHLPLFEHADPLVLPAIGLEIDLTRDGDGWTGTLRGAFLKGSYEQAAHVGYVQMVTANPQEFPSLIMGTDRNGDDVITLEEFLGDNIVSNVLTPDLRLTDDAGQWAPAPNAPHELRDALSFGIGIHLRPCASGNCQSAPPQRTCVDRILDGDETGVDCGGSCLACAGGLACKVGGDCQSGQCTAGVCAAPSCSDGVQNGFEVDVDCGHGCQPCATGKKCHSAPDCASNDCQPTADLKSSFCE